MIKKTILLFSESCGRRTHFLHDNVDDDGVALVRRSALEEQETIKLSAIATCDCCSSAIERC